MSVLMMPASQQPSNVQTYGGEEQHVCREAVPVLRRGNASQGRALEMLGHSVEYLVDSRLFALSDDAAQSDGEAVQILMRLSRAVFAECPEVISLRRRLRLWLVDRLAHSLEVSDAR